MAALNRSVKITLAISLFSLFLYVAYVFRGSYLILFGYLANSSWEVNYVTWLGPAFWASHIGITARLISLILGLATVFLLWVKSMPFVKIKGLVAAALILEAISYLGLVPSLWLLLNPSSRIYTASLGYGYVIQIVCTVPFLLALAYLVARYRDSSQKPLLLKVGALAFVGYTTALVTNEVSRWTSMIGAESLQFIEGIRAVGFLNALALMPFAVVFAAAGAYRLIRGGKTQPAMRWLGASLFVVGLNYCIYLVFAYSVNALNTLPVVDIWAIPLITLGTALIINSKRKT